MKFRELDATRARLLFSDRARVFSMVAPHTYVGSYFRWHVFAQNCIDFIYLLPLDTEPTLQVSKGILIIYTVTIL
jgi:hypothetical protein